MTLGWFIVGVFIVTIWIAPLLWFIRAISRTPYEDQPTDEHEIPEPYRMRIGQLETFGPGKPVPPSPEQLDEIWNRTFRR